MPAATSKPPASGAAPEGATDRETAARNVREMFSAIAPRYDLLNHVLSCNVDKLWWRRAARSFVPILRRPEARILDLCCGTCDLALALARFTAAEQNADPHSPAIFGADFARPMLIRAIPKIRGRNIFLIEGDALRLPFPPATFDLVVSAFGFRNLTDYDAGLRELHRILRPGGEAGILEFNGPRGMTGRLYRIYFRHVLPWIGGLISGVPRAYSYLPQSVERFPAPDEMLLRMEKAGFAGASWQPYSFGIAGLFRAKKV